MAVEWNGGEGHRELAFRTGAKTATGAHHRTGAYGPPMKVAIVIAVVVLASAITVAVSSSQGTRSTAPGGATSSRAAAVSCKGSVRQPAAPADRHDLVVGGVLMRGAKRHARDNPSDFEGRGERDGGAKIGLVLRPRTRLVLSIAPADRRKASLTYTRSSRNAKRVRDGHSAVRFRPCFSDAPSAFPGGLLLSGPGCVRVRFAINGRAPVTRRLAFGRGSC